MRIVAVTVRPPNTPVSTMDLQLSPLIPADISGNTYCLTLRGDYMGRPLAAIALNLPSMAAIGKNPVSASAHYDLLKCFNHTNTNVVI